MPRQRSHHSQSWQSVLEQNTLDSCLPLIPIRCGYCWTNKRFWLAESIAVATERAQLHKLTALYEMQRGNEKVCRHCLYLPDSRNVCCLVYCGFVFVGLRCRIRLDFIFILMFLGLSCVHVQLAFVTFWVWYPEFFGITSFAIII
jgi:hypothetical protein